MYVSFTEHVFSFLSFRLRPSLAQISAHPFIAMFRYKSPISLPAFCMNTTPFVSLQSDGTFFLSEKNTTNEVVEMPHTITSSFVQMIPPIIKGFEVFDENSSLPISKPMQQINSNHNEIPRQSYGVNTNSKAIDNVLSKVSKIKLNDESLFNSVKKASCPGENAFPKSIHLDEFFDDHVSSRDLLHLDSDTLALVKLHSTLCNVFLNSESLKFQPKSQKFANCSYLTNWISHHIDYTSKYGLGFLLNDGSVGVYFNDSTKAVLDASGERFFYVDRKTHVCNDLDRHIPELFSLSEFPPLLQKKVILLKHFKNYFMEHCHESCSSSKKCFGDMIYLKKWVRTKHAVFFRLNDNTVQVVFTDNTEILLSADGYDLTYVDKASSRTSYAVESVLCNHGLADVKKRLKYLKDIVHQLLQSSRK